jgi:hypothetical protein
VGDDGGSDAAFGLGTVAGAVVLTGTAGAPEGLASIGPRVVPGGEGAGAAVPVLELAQPVSTSSGTTQSDRYERMVRTLPGRHLAGPSAVGPRTSL